MPFHIGSAEIEKAAKVRKFKDFHESVRRSPIIVSTRVVSRNTSPTTSLPSSVTALNATGTTFGSPSDHVARSHISFFNNFITDSVSISTSPLYLMHP